MGDFNLPQTNWENNTTSTAMNDFGTKLMETVHDCFLTQHVNEVTRISSESVSNTRDLFFSNEEPILEKIMAANPQGRSDPAMIQVTCNMDENLDQESKTMYLYDKADYKLLRK